MEYRLVNVEKELYDNFDKVACEHGTRGGRLLSEYLKLYLDEFQNLPLDFLKRPQSTPQIPVNLEKDLIASLKQRADTFLLKPEHLIRVFMIREHGNNYSLARSLAITLTKQIDTSRSYTERRKIPVNQDFYNRLSEYSRICSIKNTGTVVSHILSNMLAHEDYDSHVLPEEPRNVYRTINAELMLSEQVKRKARQHGFGLRQATDRALSLASRDNWALGKESIKEWIDIRDRHIFSWEENKSFVTTGWIRDHDDFFEEIDSYLPFITNIEDADLY